MWLFSFLGSLGEVESARGGLLAALQVPLSPAVTLRLTFCLSWCKRWHFWGVKLDRCVLFLATWMTTHEQQYGQMSLFFFPFLFTFESAATTDIDRVELFPPVKLCNICVDLKMSAEPTFTEWVINGRNINQVQRGEWQTAVIRHLWDIYLLNKVLLSVISSLFFFLDG